MLRRRPTRIELTPEDLHDYVDRRAQQRAAVLASRASASAGASASVAGSRPGSRPATAHTARPGTAASLQLAAQHGMTGGVGPAAVPSFAETPLQYAPPGHSTRPHTHAQSQSQNVAMTPNLDSSIQSSAHLGADISAASASTSAWLAAPPLLKHGVHGYTDQSTPAQGGQVTPLQFGQGRDLGHALGHGDAYGGEPSSSIAGAAHDMHPIDDGDEDAEDSQIDEGVSNDTFGQLPSLPHGAPDFGVAGTGSGSAGGVIGVGTGGAGVGGGAGRVGRLGPTPDAVPGAGFGDAPPPEDTPMEQAPTAVSRHRRTREQRLGLQ